MQYSCLFTFVTCTSFEIVYSIVTRSCLYGGAQEKTIPLLRIVHGQETGALWNHAILGSSTATLHGHTVLWHYISISKNMQVLCSHIALPMRAGNWWQRPSRKSSNKLPELLYTALWVKHILYKWCIKTTCQRPKTIHQIIHVHLPGVLFQSERPETIKWSTSLLLQ